MCDCGLIYVRVVYCDGVVYYKYVVVVFVVVVPWPPAPLPTLLKRRMAARRAPPMTPGMTRAVP